MCIRDSLSHDLVAGDEAQLLGRQLAFSDVEIGTAHATGAHAEEDVSGPEARVGDIANLQRTLVYGQRSGEDGGFHGGVLPTL